VRAKSYTPRNLLPLQEPGHRPSWRPTDDSIARSDDFLHRPSNLPFLLNLVTCTGVALEVMKFSPIETWKMPHHNSWG
jgi:hypothetical protein